MKILSRSLLLLAAVVLFAGITGCTAGSLVQAIMAAFALVLALGGCGTAPTTELCDDCQIIVNPGPEDLDHDGYDSYSDCDDGNPVIHPGACDVCGDDVDSNCDGADDTCPITNFAPQGDDADGDGFVAGADCNDSNPTINPGVCDSCYDGVDN